MQRMHDTFPGADGKTAISYRIWQPDGEPRGIVQLVHGMVEFIDRYDLFATRLAGNGYVVVGHDQLGHGDSVIDRGEWGYLPMKTGFELLISDIQTLRDRTVRRFGVDLPYVIMGHSMGSFLVRDYIAYHSEGLAGAIICGTGQPSRSLANIANIIPRLIGMFRGDHYRSTFVNNLVFAGNNKRFEPARTPYDWLSRDEAVVDAYAAEPRNTFMFTVSGFATLAALISAAIDEDSFGSVSRSLPLLVVAGAQDPVGEFGTGPTEVARRYTAAGVRDVTLKLYPEDRHEILNELDREQVMSDLVAWIDERMSRTTL